MNKNIFNFPPAYLQEMAKKRYIQMTGSDDKWEGIIEICKEYIKPQCEYIIFKREEINVHDNALTVEGQTFHCDIFSNMPEEIIGDIAVYAMTAGETPTASDSVLNETLTDIVFTAYIDAMRDILRSEFQEEYIVSGSMAPGIDGMPVEEIQIIDKLLDLSAIGISLNDHMTMIPQKSAAGLFMFFREEHPVNTNSCATCMARGKGCDFCVVGKE